jgi:hypothetical protein
MQNCGRTSNSSVPPCKLTSKLDSYAAPIVLRGLAIAAYAFVFFPRHILLRFLFRLHQHAERQQGPDRHQVERQQIVVTER